ncbi:MAG: Crp/Fnr family transcriptional regulator [Deltaproteobacteria bacterium]|nr:MAG: Crp/Fnr family transcriptional regulator [Deltaproteobacteria bacterium]
MTELHHIFRQIFSQFPENTIMLFADSFRERHYKKGDTFLQDGSICRNLAFIQKGAMMCYYVKNGKRYIDEFSLDHEFITDYSSFIHQTPSDKTIECLEDSTVFSISYDSLQTLYQMNSVTFERLGRVMSEQLYCQWHEKSKSLLMDDAREKYLKLIGNRPGLPQRIPQYLIAEYLGITPESLSRVRSGLVK